MFSILFLLCLKLSKSLHDNFKDSIIKTQILIENKFCELFHTGKNPDFAQSSYFDKKQHIDFFKSFCSGEDQNKAMLYFFPKPHLFNFTTVHYDDGHLEADVERFVQFNSLNKFVNETVAEKFEAKKKIFKGLVNEITLRKKNRIDDLKGKFGLLTENLLEMMKEFIKISQEYFYNLIKTIHELLQEFSDFDRIELKKTKEYSITGKLEPNEIYEVIVLKQKLELQLLNKEFRFEETEDGIITITFPKKYNRINFKEYESYYKDPGHLKNSASLFEMILQINDGVKMAFEEINDESKKDNQEKNNESDKEESKYGRTKKILLKIGFILLILTLVLCAILCLLPKYDKPMKK